MILREANFSLAFCSLKGGDVIIASPRSIYGPVAHA